MNKTKRNVEFRILVALTSFVCWFFAISYFILGVLEGDEGSWIISLLFSIGGTVGVFFVTCPLRFANALRKSKSYITESLHSGGKQMLCDIIKWTVIIIIAAIVFTIAYRIAITQ